MRKVKQCLDEMKIVEKNLDDIWDENDERWGEKRSDEMRWDEVRSVKCGVSSVTFGTAHHFRTKHAHGPGWRNGGHKLQSSIGEKGLIVHP